MWANAKAVRREGEGDEVVDMNSLSFFSSLTVSVTLIHFFFYVFFLAPHFILFCRMMPMLAVVVVVNPKIPALSER